MVDTNKKIEITEDFLEKHRNNTRKYMHLVSSGRDTPENIQETLSRIESKFGVSLKRSQSQENPKESIRVSSDEKSLQEFIKQIREKYLGPTESLRIVSPSISEPLIDLSPVKASLINNTSQKLSTENKLLQEKTIKQIFVPNDLLNLDYPNTTIPIKTPIKKTQDSALELSDLISEPSPIQISPYNKPPRTRHILEESLHETPEKEDNNKTIYDNSMSMSFRRIHAEQIISTAISEVITSRLKIQKKRNSPRNNNGKPFSFEKFLNSGKVKFAPLKKTISIEQVYKDDKTLQKLLQRKEEILKELDYLTQEKQKLLAQRFSN